jgi:hypothetical protein
MHKPLDPHAQAGVIQSKKLICARPAACNADARVTNATRRR